MGRARTDPEEAAMELVGEGTQHGAGDTKTKVKQNHVWNEKESKRGDQRRTLRKVKEDRVRAP